MMQEMVRSVFPEESIDEILDLIGETKESDAEACGVVRKHALLVATGRHGLVAHGGRKDLVQPTMERRGQSNEDQDESEESIVADATGNPKTNPIVFQHWMRILEVKAEREQRVRR